jgi:hypothetical protein
MTDATLNDFEKLIDESFDNSHLQLMDIVPYISSMPEEYTTALTSSGKGIEDTEVSPLLWSSEILGYTIPEGEPKYAEKDVYAGI